jgi:outer membrane protein TolC
MQIYGSSIKSNSNQAPSLSTSTDTVSSGEVGLLNDTRSSLITDDPLSTQNYNDITSNTDYSDYNNYQKITLKRVILETLSQSDKLKAAKEKLLVQAKIDLINAKAEYLPKINFQFNTQKETKSTILKASTGLRETVNSNEDKYKITLDQPLYSGGSTKINIKIASLKYQEAKNKYEIVVNQIIQDAIKSYFQLLFNIQKVNLSEKNMKKLKEILEISQIKFDSGAIGVGDLASIKVGVSSAETQMNRLKSKLADSIDYYIYLLGDKFQKTKPFQKNFDLKIGTYEELKDAIVSNNLTLLNYRLNITREKYKIQNFKVSFEPKIDLQLKANHILNQENFIDDEESYSAKIVFKYNIFNQGKDINKITKAHSKIQEQQYRYKEEIKKISWDSSKLYNSIKSLKKSLKSNKDEIESANEMVDIYWEGFQLGEQDLQVLLQGQKQLNTAELSILKFKQDYLTNLFKVLNQTNKLASFFNINPYDTYFIDYSKVAQLNHTVDLKISLGNPLDDLNTTINSYLELISEYSYDDIVNFKDRFLEADDENYTILIDSFPNNYKAYSYIKSNRLFTDAFAYDYINENVQIDNTDVNKNIKVLTNVVYGIYENRQKAVLALDDMDEYKDKTFKIVKVKDIKKLYTNYINGLQANIEAYIIKPKKLFQTDQKFKNKFLKANKNYFTINIVSLSNISQAEKLLAKYDITKDSFVFKYGRKAEWIKVMYGVYPTYEKALQALNSKPKMKKRYYPIIEQVYQKQILYKKYKKYNKKLKIKTKIEKANLIERKKENEELLKKKIVNLQNEIQELKQKNRDTVLDDIELDIKLEDISKIEEVQIPIEVKPVKKEEQKIPTEVKPIKIEEIQIPEEEIHTIKQKNILDKIGDSTLQKKEEVPLLDKTLNKTKSIATIKDKVIIADEKDIKPLKKLKLKLELKKYKTQFEKDFYTDITYSYTILLTKISKSNLRAFVKRYIIDDQYLVKKSNNKYMVLYGLFTTKEQAVKAIENLHPKIINSSKIVLIKDIR